MISRTNNTAFGTAYAGFRPTNISVAVPYTEVLEKPVIDTLKQIASDAKDTFCVGTKPSEIESKIPRFQISPNTRSMINFEQGNERFVLINPSLENKEAYNHLYNLVRENLHL